MAKLQYRAPGYILTAITSELDRPAAGMQHNPNPPDPHPPEPGREQQQQQQQPADGPHDREVQQQQQQPPPPLLLQQQQGAVEGPGAAGQLPLCAPPDYTTKLQAAEPQNIASAAWALANLRWQADEPAWEALAQAACDRMTAFSGGCARLGCAQARSPPPPTHIICPRTPSLSCCSCLGYVLPSPAPRPP